MTNTRIYVPKSSARAKQTQYGELLNLSFDVDALVAFAGQHGNEKGRLNLTVSARKEPGKFGETHNITLDTFVPRAKSDATGYAGDSSDDIGF